MELGNIVALSDMNRILSAMLLLAAIMVVLLSIGMFSERLKSRKGGTSEEASETTPTSAEN